MAEEIKRIDAQILMDAGLLWQINRKVLHPLGLALEVIITDQDALNKELQDIKDIIGGIESMHDTCDGPDRKAFLDAIRKMLVCFHDQTKKLGKTRAGGLWDYQDDPEGMLYGEESLEHGMKKFHKFMKETGADRLVSRMKKLGYIYQGPSDETFLPEAICRPGVEQFGNTEETNG